MKKKHLLPLLVGVLLIFTFAVIERSSAQEAGPLINEVLASHSGSDNTEFVELYGTPGASLSGLSLIVVEGDAFGPGTIDRQFDFKPFHKIGSNGFFLFGNCGGLGDNYGVIPDASLFSNYLENSSLTVALVETASISGDSVSGNEVVRDTVALTDGDVGDTFYFDAPVIGPDGPYFPAGARRLVDGIDTDTPEDWTISSFFLPGANNPVGGGFDGCAPIQLTIPEIQGEGQFSDYQGEVVVTQGTVTLYSANGRDFWMQNPIGDGNPTTSDALVVDDGGFLTPKPQIGDMIEITAVVEEQQFGNALPLTRLDSPSDVTIISSSNPLPPAVMLTDLPNESMQEGEAFWEALEGMLVEIHNGFVVAPTNRFGEFVMLTETDADADLGSGYYAQTKQALIRNLGGDEVDYNPERIMVDDTSVDDPIVVMPGDRVRSLVGVVDYTFGMYKLQPADFEIKTHKLPKMPVSSRSGRPGNVVITTYNVENLFDLEDNPDKEDEGSTPSPDELETQLNKLALSIMVELELPDILVAQEVENTAILQELGDRINAAAGTDYQAVSFETSDVRGIEVGFLWDDNRVDLLSAEQMSGPDVEAWFGPSSPSPGREPLVGVFNINGHEVTIIGNHFKSKGGDDPLYGVNWPPFRVTEIQRKGQAGAVRAYVDDIFAADAEALVMVTGDLNDFQFSEPGEGADHPVAILEGINGGIPLTNLLELEKDAETYTYVFDGNSQVLDHMLVSPALFELFTSANVLHFNAGYPSVIGYDETVTLRASDHDPLEGHFRFK
jgi:predicted extracellular nuclease